MLDDLHWTIVRWRRAVFVCTTADQRIGQRDLALLVRTPVEQGVGRIGAAYLTWSWVNMVLVRSLTTAAPSLSVRPLAVPFEPAFFRGDPVFITITIPLFKTNPQSWFSLGSNPELDFFLSQVS